MDLRLLEIFCLVYEEKSFSKAAVILQLSQPTISDHIRSLESQVGSKLFDRLGRKIQPTRGAELLYDYGRQIVALRKTAENKMKEFMDRLEGRLVVGGSTIPGEYILPGLVSAFARGFPDVQVKLDVADTKAILARLEAGDIEVGFVGAQLRSTRVKYEEFAEDEVVLVVPNTAEWKRVQTLSVTGLSKYPFVMREAGSGTRMMFEKRLKELGHTLAGLTISVEAGSSSAVKEAVKEGLGIGLVSSRAILLDIKAGLLKVVRLREGGAMKRKFFIAMDSRRYNSPICSAFIQFVNDSAKT